MSGSAFVGYWREGKRLVMDRNAMLPDRCIKCDEPAYGYRKTVKLQHVNTGAHILVGAIAYAFAKRATIEVGLCERHRRSPALTIALISIATMVLAFAGMTASAVNPFVPLLAAIAFIGGVVGLVVAFLRTTHVAATKITDTHIWLKGVGEPFLASAPPAPVVEPGAPLPTLAAPKGAPPEPAVAADLAYRAMRRGALAFLIGGLITAGTYLALSGSYYIAWGPMAFGLYLLVRGARPYLAIPAEFRTTTQLATLGGMLAIGLLAGGWVAFQELEADQFTGEVKGALASQQQGATLFADVMNRNGNWTTKDAADMVRVAGLYGQAADALGRSHPPTSVAWYRDGLTKNFRDAQDIATGFSRLGPTSTQSSFDALIRRWRARVDELNELQARLDRQLSP